MGDIRFSWIIVGIAAASILFGALFGWQRLTEPCVDAVPAHDGRCWGERALVVEQGVAVCRCRRTP